MLMENSALTGQSRVALVARAGHYNIRKVLLLWLHSTAKGDCHLLF